MVYHIHTFRELRSSSCVIRPPRQRLCGQEGDQCWLEKWNQRDASKRCLQGSGLGVLTGGTHLYMCQRQPAAALSDRVISVNHRRKLPPGSSRGLKEAVWGCFLCVYHYFSLARPGSRVSSKALTPSRRNACWTLTY